MKNDLLQTIALALLLLAPLATAHAGDAASDLAQARRLEHTNRDMQGALERYEQVLQAEELQPGLKLEAMYGAARCLKALERIDAAASYWRRIVEAASLTEDDRAKARAELEQYDQARKAEAERRSAGEKAEAQREAEERRRTSKANGYLQEAEVIIKSPRGDFDKARRLIMEANALMGGESPKAARLQQRLDELEPGEGELLRNLLGFFESTRMEALSRLRQEAGDLYEARRRQVNDELYAQAHLAFLKGISLIDESGFLASAELIHTDPVAELRESLRLFAEANIGKARAAGIVLDQPIPPPPATKVTPRLLPQLYRLLEEAYGSRSRGKERLRFYPMKASVPSSGLPNLTSSPFEGGLEVGLEPGTLVRVGWAERWIRGTWTARWTARRLLERFGDVLCVKSRSDVHRRVEELRVAFADRPAPLTVDLQLYAASNAGVVQASEALAHLVVGRSPGGHDRIIRRTLKETGEHLRGLMETPLKLVGTANLALDGHTSALLTITARTD